MDTVYGIERVCSVTVKGAKVSAARGSVVDYTGTAIVNAANEGCVRGGGVDGAVNQRGGEALIAAREALPVLHGNSFGGVRCPTGQCKTTSAGDLDCQWVLHAVGPNYHCEEEGEADRLLYSAYRSAMVEAKRKRCPDVAFCLLSAGIFRASKPLKDVLALGALAVSACVYDGLEEVFLVGFTPREVTYVTEVVEGLLGDDGAAATEALFARCGPAVQAMHLECLAGIVEPEQPIGLAMAWQAAAAGAAESELAAAS